MGEKQWEKTFGGDSVRKRISDQAQNGNAEYDILGELLAFLTYSRLLLTELGEMTGADKAINTLHFGSDPTDILIWINQEILVDASNV